MAEIETEAEFFAAVEECLAAMPDLYRRYPDKQGVIGEIELQLDIMRRRTKDGQIPTELERERIKIQWQTKHHFPFGQHPRKVEMVMQRLRDIAFCYRNWEEVRP